MCSFIWKLQYETAYGGPWCTWPYTLPLPIGWCISASVTCATLWHGVAWHSSTQASPASNLISRELQRLSLPKLAPLMAMMAMMAMMTMMAIGVRGDDSDDGNDGQHDGEDGTSDGRW